MSTDTPARRPLSIEERDRLADMEGTIKAGLETFEKVGTALATIRNERLYRDTHGTFEDYVRDRWQMSKPYATRLIQASDTMLTLQAVPIGTMPANEAQVRPLAGLPAEQQREAWTEAVETAPKDDAGRPKITAKHVAETVNGKTARPRRTRQEMRVGQIRHTLKHFGFFRESLAAAADGWGDDLPDDLVHEAVAELRRLADAANRIAERLEGARG